ncbi:MAG: RNA-splicing ligase RtcB [Candidatus Moranbacteria bacterium RIFCSPLOWO2_02_FULL_48_19]|nr:MAG: RNA-splicing ligase RtcB [Candidatus Moranbacteria bacterium RIFCSPLOWO2_02_FULL_48_19]OGI31298.1 MAG: RNA-splicing ligase RtcB [Candidatus Moranbacteria bacterium RIFCSPLOWO2_12_FULL_48_12]
MFDFQKIRKITPVLWEIPRSFRDDMRVPARFYSHEAMLHEVGADRALEQLVNVATLPGIQGWALAMPDMHEGYGFPIGGVAAFDRQEGIISPGGIGYDINCGVRLLRTGFAKEEIKDFLRDVGRTIFSHVPSGVGRGGKLSLRRGQDFDAVLLLGARRMLELGYGIEEDLAHIESGGKLEGAQPALVSEHAKYRGRDQLGTMGAGNHFVEVGYVETIFDAAAAQDLHLAQGQVTVLIHTGSRGLGHQVATDYIRLMNRVMENYGIHLPDRELACVPFSSKEGQEYFAAMQAAANFAWANRQLVTCEVREAFQRVFGQETPELSVVYDVAHNIAKVEEYEIKGVRKEVIVHRKGATRAFPGQPVLIPGSMGTASYVLLGQEASLVQSFGSSCHGAGRRMSRTRARRQTSAALLREDLSAQGIVINSGSKRGLAEEAPFAYKDIDDVVDVIHEAGIAKKVARLRPLAVIKG